MAEGAVVPVKGSKVWYIDNTGQISEGEISTDPIPGLEWYSISYGEHVKLIVRDRCFFSKEKAVAAKEEFDQAEKRMWERYAGMKSGENAPESTRKIACLGGASSCNRAAITALHQSALDEKQIVKKSILSASTHEIQVGEIWKDAVLSRPDTFVGRFLEFTYIDDGDGELKTIKKSRYSDTVRIKEPSANRSRIEPESAGAPGGAAAPGGPSAKRPKTEEGGSRKTRARARMNRKRGKSGKREKSGKRVTRRSRSRRV